MISVGSIVGFGTPAIYEPTSEASGLAFHGLIQLTRKRQDVQALEVNVVWTFRQNVFVCLDAVVIGDGNPVVHPGITHLTNLVGQEQQRCSLARHRSHVQDGDDGRLEVGRGRDERATLATRLTMAGDAIAAELGTSDLQLRAGHVRVVSGADDVGERLHLEEMYSIGRAKPVFRRLRRTSYSWCAETCQPAL